MKRQLTPREWMLLGVLGILVIVSGYIGLFYMPMTSERDRCISEAEDCRLETEAAEIRLAEKRRMEKELEEIFAANPDPLSIPDYDNLKPVMFELNSILAETDNYTLTFGTVDTSESIIRRGISMSFTCGSYDSAKGVLEKLHDSSYRCMLDNLNVSLGSYSRNNFWDEDYYDNSVVVSGDIVFFEYQAAQGD